MQRVLENKHEIGHRLYVYTMADILCVTLTWFYLSLSLLYALEYTLMTAAVAVDGHILHSYSQVRTKKVKIFECITCNSCAGLSLYVYVRGRRVG